jgi:hypothetical protein
VTVGLNASSLYRVFVKVSLFTREERRTTVGDMTDGGVTESVTGSADDATVVAIEVRRGRGGGRRAWRSPEVAEGVSNGGGGNTGGVEIKVGATNVGAEGTGRMVTGLGDALGGIAAGVCWARIAA